MAGILIVDQIQNSSNTLLINSGALAANTVGTSQIQSGVVISAANVTTSNLVATGTTTFTNNVSMPNTFGFKNRIINGDFKISQYNGTSSTTAANNGYAIDRFIFKGSQASKFSIQQLSASPPAGFNTYIGLTVTSPVTIGSGDYFALGQRIEGYNIQDFGLGTSSNQPFVLSFWVYSSLTGTFGGAITSGGGDASYGFNYSIASANTWTYITVPITGTATGTWNANSNSIGMQVYFGLGVGSTYSATAGSWGTTNAFGSTGSVSVVSTNGATWYATGIQIEKGTQATSFDYRPYGTELALCQRYAWVIKGIGAGNQMVAGPNFPRLGVYQYLAYGSGTSTPVPMRIAPSLTASGNFQWITYGSTPGDGYTTGLVASGGVNLTAASNTYVAYRIGNTGNSNFGSAMVIFLLDYDGTAVLINSAEL